MPDASLSPASGEARAEFRWASETGAHGMPHPEELEYLGFVRVARHPRWPSSWLMKR